MYNYNSVSSYSGYGSFPTASTTNPSYSQQAHVALNGIYSNYQQQYTNATRGFPQTTTPTLNAYSGYDYTSAYKAPSAENPYGVTAGRLHSAPVGFTSAGNLSTTPGGGLGAYSATAAQAATPGIATGTHYDGYDAAVLAAASSYIVSKSSGMGNNWLNMKSSRIHPDATFPSKKRPGVGHHRSIPKETQTFYCDICKISCAGNNAYQDHLKGKNHKKKEAVATGANQISLPKNKVSFRCEICEVTCTGRDTYDAHAKGTRHQKTLALLKKMGKPLPSIDPVVIAPQDAVPNIPAPIPIVGSEVIPPPKTKVVGVTATNFVSGSNLTTTEIKVETGTNDQAEKEAVDAYLEAEAQIQPVGEEYVDSKYDAKGKLVEYHCRLCECSFTDPNAKNVHTKGRRHRLSYKNKVDSNLKVELKGSSLARNRKDKQKGPKAAPPNFSQASPLPHQWLDMDNSVFASNYPTDDDKHVIKKYNDVKMDDAKFEGANRLVEAVENALKAISNEITEADFHDVSNGVSEEKKKESDEKDKDVTEQPQPERILRGLMKVGLLAHGILKNDDEILDLVVLAGCIPTKPALEKIIQLLPKHFDAAYTEKLNVSMDFDHAGFLVEVGGFDIKVRVTLTSPLMRQYEGKSNEMRASKELDCNALPLAPCLAALAELRRAKWYQARASPIEGMNMTMVVLREVRQRVNTWEPLTSWMLAMFVQHVLESFGYPMSPGDALRRVFEAVSSGIILSKRAVLYDPCEKEKIDVMESLSAQQREDITSSAQHALRLIVFNQLHRVLDMERIENVDPQNINGRKRPYESDENKGEDVVELKKEKLSME